MIILRQSAPWLVILVGLVASFATSGFYRRLEQDALRADFAGHCQTIAHAIETSLHAHENVLHGLRQLFDYSDEVRRDEFAGIATEIVRRQPTIHQLDWVPRVEAAARAEFERAARSDGAVEYGIHDWEPGTERVWATPAREVYYPVLFSHPENAQTRFILGFDVAGGSALPDLRRAERERRVIASAPRPLEPGAYSYVLVMPVFGAATVDLAESARGYLLMIGRARALIAPACQAAGPGEAELLVIDDAAPPADRRLYFHTAASAGAVPDEASMRSHPFAQVLPVYLANRRWDLVFRPTDAWMAARRSQAPLAVFAVGALASVLLGASLRSARMRAEAVEREVVARTAELRQTQSLLQEDIQRRQAAERKVLLSEARLQAIIDHSPALIWVKDLEGRYLLANRAFRSLLLTGSRAPEGRTDTDLFAPEFAAYFHLKDRQVIESGESQLFEETVVAPEGSRLTFLTQKFLLRDATGRAYGVGGLATDISVAKASEATRLSLQKQLMEAQKLESLGVLAGGIAHDFNNILTAILGHASLARTVMTADHPAAGHLEQIERSSRRATELCAQMLAYAGKGRVVVAPLDLGELVRDTAALVRVTLRKSTVLRLEMGADLPAVSGDGAQLRQIVMNLLINAADAVAARADGAITVTSFVRELTADFFRGAVAPAALPPGRYVGLEVVDNGCGMSDEVRARIFEPFFTTKFSGRGLGLAAALGIVQGHGGALFVDSVEGAGTVFRLFLPALIEAAAPVAAPAADARAPISGTVLVVDDEEDVRQVACGVLSRFGARTLEAASGDAALDLCRADASRIDVVLLDLTMPGLSGEETLRRLRELGVTARVVIASGFGEADVMARCKTLGAGFFLQKPFEIDQLLAVVRRALAN